jgi:hypothetical protein
MRTPGAFRPGWLAETDRKCVVCRDPLRPGQEKFCGDRCRWKADANARQAISRIKQLLSRRDLIRGSLATTLAFAVHVESRPDSSGARRTHTASVLHELDLLLSHRGPQDPEVRSFTRVQADAIRLAYEAEPTSDQDDVRHYVHALEILRDAGSENPADVERLLQYAHAVAKFYAERKDYLDLARSWQALANTCRIAEDKINGKKMTHQAWQILNEKFSQSRVPEVLTIVHQSAFWDLRLFADDIERADAEAKREQIVDLAETVNTPAIWVETHRELAGHFGRNREYEDEARTELCQLEIVRKENPDLATHDAPTFLRPEIEILLESGRKGDKDEAIHLIETEYLALYNRDRHVYFYNRLKDWERKYSLSLQVPPPTYASPILPYLPRGRG